MKIVRSFGYASHEVPTSGRVIDVRQMGNPHHAGMADKTGHDQEVRDFVAADARFDILFGRAKAAVLSGENDISFGCHGGKHRSVAMAIMFANWLRDMGYEVLENHRRDDA